MPSRSEGPAMLQTARTRLTFPSACIIYAAWTDWRPYPDSVDARATVAERVACARLARIVQPHTAPVVQSGRGAALRRRRLPVRIRRGAPGRLSRKTAG